MKKDLFTVVAAAIAGIVIAYFVTSMILPAIENFTIKNLGSNLTYSLTEPDDEIFNFRAVNPTVEVYVGQCAEYSASGECINTVTTNENDEFSQDGLVEDSENQDDTPAQGEETDGATD